MSELKLKCDYSRRAKRKFFNDQKPKEYHLFIILNPEIIPDEYLYSAEKKRQKVCRIWIVDDLVKRAKIDFGDLHGNTKEYKFIINLEGAKVAKFNTNNKNWMVLKTKEYFENTVQKIGFWDSENYFYEVNKKDNSNKTENKNYWGKIILFCLPIIMLALFILLIIKWGKAKKKKRKIY